MPNPNEVMDVEQLRDQISKLLTHGIGYGELEWSAGQGGEMTPEFGNRFSSDVLNEVDKIIDLVAQQNAALLRPLIELIDDISGCEEYERSTDSLRCKWCGETEYNRNHDKMRLLQAIPASILEAKLKEIEEGI